MTKYARNPTPWAFLLAGLVAGFSLGIAYTVSVLLYRGAEDVCGVEVAEVVP